MLQHRCSQSVDSWPWTEPRTDSCLDLILQLALEFLRAPSQTAHCLCACPSARLEPAPPCRPSLSRASQAGPDERLRLRWLAIRAQQPSPLHMTAGSKMPSRLAVLRNPFTPSDVTPAPLSQVGKAAQSIISVCPSPHSHL